MLLALVRNWGHVGKWRVARIILRAKECVSDLRIQSALHWLTVFNGNWSLAKDEIKSSDLVKWVDGKLYGGRKGGAS